MKKEYGSNSLSIIRLRLDSNLAPPLQEAKYGLCTLMKKTDIIIQLVQELLKRIDRPHEICGGIK
jgi:hypothetical protein